MISYTINNKHFLSFILHDASNVLIKFLFPAWKYNGIAILNSKNNLNVNLRIGVCHGC